MGGPKKKTNEGHGRKGKQKKGNQVLRKGAGGPCGGQYVQVNGELKKVTPSVSGTRRQNRAGLTKGRGSREM